MAQATFEVEFTLDRKAVERIAGGQDVTLALERIGQVGETSAKRNAPVDTATLQRSITHELGSRGFDQYVRIGTNIFYAIFQEIGTINHPAHPYLRPALQDIESFVKRGEL